MLVTTDTHTHGVSTGTQSVTLVGYLGQGRLQIRML